MGKINQDGLADSFCKNPHSKENFIKQIVLSIIHLQNEMKDWEPGWRPLNKGFLPFNAVTGDYYRGLNLLWLLTVSAMAGYHDNRWMTFKQMQKLSEKTGVKLHLRVGEKGTSIIFPKSRKNSANLCNMDDFDEREEEELEEDLATSSYYDGNAPAGYGAVCVFNASQIDGMPPYDDDAPMSQIERNALVEKFIASSGIEVKHAQSRKCPAYSPYLDKILMPYPGRFHSIEEYYAAKLHEFYHATGHAERDDRQVTTNKASREYAVEEVRAEIFSVLAGHMLDLPLSDANAASYIAHFQKNIPEDGPGLLKLASQAGNMLTTLAEFASGRKPSAKWFPPKKAWSRLLRAQKNLDKDLPGFKSK